MPDNSISGTPDKSHWVSTVRGNLPIVLTVPHDGILSAPGGDELPENRSIRSNTMPRDTGVQAIARDIVSRVYSATGKSPSLVCMDVQRKRRSLEIQRYYESTVMGILEMHGTPDMRTILLDLHGFRSQTDDERYDIILGTGHGSSVGTSGLECAFSRFMVGRGYYLYVPGRIPVHGERYSAEGTDEAEQIQPLMRVLKERHIPHTVAMQVEIAAEYRNKNDTARGIALARDIGDFLVSALQSPLSRG